jgi:hypothetical protein
MASKSPIYIDEKGLKQLQNAQRMIAQTASSKDLTKRLNAKIRVATKPIEVDLKKTALDLDFVRTSRAGGSRANRSGRSLKSGKWKQGRSLRQEMQFGIKTKVSKSANSAGVRITEENPKTEVNRIARAINSKGQVRHPLFGNKDYWYMTKTKNGKGWFDKTGERHVPHVRAYVNTIVRDFTEDLASKIK